MAENIITGYETRGNKKSKDSEHLEGSINPLLTKENMDRYFIRRSILNALTEFLPRCFGVFLDIGCGEMPYRPLILELNKRIERYIGLDIINPLYQQSCKPVLFWDGKSIPLADCSVNCAIATELFEHVTDIETTLKEIQRVLKVGGNLFFTVPFLWPLHDTPQDEYRYTPFSLRRHVQNSGFEEIQLRALGGWDASLAQMMGLWVKRSPMTPSKREQYTERLFPFYRTLIDRELKNKRLDYDEMLSEGPMITGLYGIATKPFRKEIAVSGSNHQRSDNDAVKRSERNILALVCPQIGAASETFIRSHIQHIAPESTVVLTGAVLDKTWFSGPVKIVPHSYGWSRYSPEVETEVIEFLKQHHATLILCEFGSVGTAIVELNQRVLHLPIFVHFYGQDASEELRKPEMVSYYQWMGKHVSGIIAVSKPMAERLIAIGIPETKVNVIHYGVDVPDKIRANHGISPCRFVSVSRLVPKKGVLNLLRAFESARQVVPEITLDIIGEGPLREELETFISAHNLKDSILLHGQKPHSFVLKMLSKTSAYAQHSITDPLTGNAEGLPAVILEASAHELPVVSTFHEGIPEAIENGVTGFLVNEGDTEKMAEYMVKLAQDGELRKRIGLAGKNKIIKEGFTTEAMIDSIRNTIGISNESTHDCFKNDEEKEISTSPNNDVRNWHKYQPNEGYLKRNVGKNHKALSVCFFSTPHCLQGQRGAF